MIFRASHAPRFTGFDSRPSDRPARIAGWVSKPPRSRRPCGMATNPKPLSVLLAEIVVAGDGFIGDHEIRLDQISRRQVVADQVLQELDGLLLRVARACRWVSLGNCLRSGSSTWNLSRLSHCDANSPAKRENRASRDHPRHFGIQLLAQRAGRGQLQRLAIGRPVPQEVRELGSQFVAVERLGRGRRAGLHQEQELRRGQHHQQRILDALAETRARGRRLLVDRHQRRLFRGGDRTAVGARREIVNDLARICRLIVLAVEIDEDVAVRTRAATHRSSGPSNSTERMTRRGMSRPSVYSLRTPIS